MRARFLSFAATVAVAVLPSVASASECERRALGGSWILTAGTEMLCALDIRNNGRFEGTCLRMPGEPEPVPLSGRAALNGQCVLRLSGDDNWEFEGRAWSTANPTRMDAFQGILGWKVEEGLPVMGVSGYRRPNSDLLPLD